MGMLTSHKKTIFEALGRKPIHPFPARMAPGIALDALSKHERPLRVLDPMSGSGTVLAVARANGHRAYGIDLDPLAVLLATVWTRTVDAELVLTKAEQVLSRARRDFRSLKASSAYPAGSDDDTRAFLRYWFDAYARRQLTALANAIRRVHSTAVRDVLWCGFSRLIITKRAGASLAMDLSHSRPHRVFDYAPVKPFNQFSQAVRRVVANCNHKGDSGLGPSTNVRLGDARDVNMPSSSIDMVLTSPPYLNAIDYLRCSKFSLVWMGYTTASLRTIRSDSVGAEAQSEEASSSTWVEELLSDLSLKPQLTKRDSALLSRYVWDMDASLREASRVLKPNGSAVYVVGDSTIRGTFVRNSAIVVSVAARHGLHIVSRHVRDLPANRRYLPPPSKQKTSAAMDARMRQEVVLEFEKPGARVA